MSVLSLADVWKGYDRGASRLWVLQGVSLEVAAGEVVAVVGTRDQGKTTLLKVAAGIERADAGSVRLGDHDVAELRDRDLSRLLRTHVGLATRGGPELPMDVSDYVGLHLASGSRRGRRERRAMTLDALELLGVEDCARARWDEISNWQRVRVELAQAVASRPSLLLVDDLLDGLGMGKVQEATAILRMLAETVGCGVLMAASDHISAVPSDRVWQLDARKLRLMVDHTQESAEVIELSPQRQARAR